MRLMLMPPSCLARFPLPLGYSLGMEAPPWVAWIGACTGVASLFWNIYTKLTSGPNLRVTAFADMIQMPPPPGNPSFLDITVQNVGTATTTITNVCFKQYDSRWKRFRNRSRQRAAVLNHYQGPQLPQKLEVGGEWRANMQQDAGFDEWLASGKLWCEIVHSFGKPVSVKILAPVPRTKSKSLGESRPVEGPN